LVEIDTSTEAARQTAYQLRYLPDSGLVLLDTRRNFAALVETLAAERDALKAPRGYATCAHCGGQNGWIEADMAAEVERRCAAAYADRDRLAAEVAKLREALMAARLAAEIDTTDHAIEIIDAAPAEDTP
jgi:hypothetical protein